MKKIFIILIFIFISNNIFANPIILDCTCIKTYFYETSRSLDCYSGDHILEIDLKKRTVDYLDSDGKDQIKRIKKMGAVIEISEINSAEIEFYFSFYNEKQILRLFTLNRYTGQLKELSYADNILTIDYESICVKTKALF